MAKLKVFVVSIVALVVLAYIGVCGYLYLKQESFIFYPTKLDSDYRYTFTERFDEATVDVGGASINVVRFLAEDPRGVILYVHGNGDIIPSLEGIASYFVSLGYDAVIPDYRGYGKSTGQIENETNLHADMKLIYQYMLSHYSEGDITVYGQSLGTGLSIPLAASHSPKRLILESPYFSMVDLVRSHLPFLPGFLLKYQLRSDHLIGKVDCPVYVIHGGQDTLIPIEQGERLYSLIKSKGEFLHLPDAGHGPLLGDIRLQKFLGRVLQLAD